MMMTRIYLVGTDGKVKQHIETLTDGNVPRVGDHVSVEHDDLEVIKVSWCPNKWEMDFADVYIIEEDDG